MRKYGLWVVWFQKDIPTEIPNNGNPISWKEVLARKMPFSPQGLISRIRDVC